MKLKLEPLYRSLFYISINWSLLFPVHPLLPHILAGVLQEACHDQDDHRPDGKRRYNADGLQVAHGAVREDQGDREQDQQNAPHELDPLVGHFPVLNAVIAVAGRDQRNGVKGRGVKGDHGEQQQDEHEGGAGQRLDDGDDHIVQIARFFIQRDKICLPGDLQPQRIVAENDKADDRGIPRRTRTRPGSSAGPSCPWKCCR